VTTSACRWRRAARAARSDAPLAPAELKEPDPA
jgi:hypothetical protein